MKKLVIAVTLSASFLGLAACGSNDSDPDVVVESKAGDISKEDFYEELKDRHGEQVLNELVTMKVLEDKYDVKDKEVDKEVKKVKDELGDQFEMVLQQQGFEDEEAFRKVIRESLLQEAALSEDVEIKDKEIKKQYERMKTEIKAQHILVEDEKTAKEIKKKLDDGEDFAKLAEEYSTDESNKDDGGKLGYFSVGEMDPAIEDAAYSMKKCKVSDPIQNQYGCQIMKVNEKSESEKEIGSNKENREYICPEYISDKIDRMEAQEKITKLLEDADINVQTEEYKDTFKKDSPQIQ